tara:strand:- start:1501 stop:2028 length:528 start_codon:yes stop_codon:yes gene_type:complete
MKKSVGIATGVGIAIIVGVIAFQLSGTMWEQVSVDEYYKKDGKVAGVVYPDNPQFLGPLQINKDKYLLGENVYLILKDVMPGDRGQVQIFTPGGELYYTLDFVGDEKSSFKKYFKPQLLKGKNLCEKEDLVGEWTIMFRSYEENVLNFEIVNSILPNQEYQYEECEVAYELNPVP